MFRRRLVPVLLIVLLVVGLLTIGGYAGWSQGYSAGVAEGVEGGTVVYAPYADGFSAGFFGIALFFKIALFLLLFFFIASLFKFWGWRTAGGPHGRYYDRGWQKHHGDRPEWGRHGPAEQYDPDDERGDRETKV